MANLRSICLFVNRIFSLENLQLILTGWSLVFNWDITGSATNKKCRWTASHNTINLFIKQNKKKYKVFLLISNKAKM